MQGARQDDRLTEGQCKAIDAVVRAERADLIACALTSVQGVRAGGPPRLTINFHPDRLTRDGHTVIEGLASTGRYRNQFEVGYTNGVVSPEPGGLRDRCERAMYGGAYHRPGTRPEERPKYGSLTFDDSPYGGWPRFGSCHLVLKPQVLDRVTVSVGDSVLGPSWLAGSATAVAAAAAGRTAPSEPRLARRLDGPLEAQVHGPVDLGRDVEAISVDPSFVGTPVADGLALVHARFGVPWHTGPPVERSAQGWSTTRDQELVRRALQERASSGQPCTAAWVGVVARSSLWAWTSGDDKVIGEIAKFLWNELFSPTRPA